MPANPYQSPEERGVAGRNLPESKWQLWLSRCLAGLAVPFAFVTGVFMLMVIGELDTGPRERGVVLFWYLEIAVATALSALALAAAAYFVRPPRRH